MKPKKCKLTINDIPCELADFFRSQAFDNNRTIGKELITVLQEYKNKKYKPLASNGKSPMPTRIPSTID